MKYPHYYSELGWIAIPVVCLFVWIFNAHRMGKFRKENKNRRAWIIGGILLTLLVLGFLIWYIGSKI